MDQQLTEDNFDDVARQAGDALRRPAPADGVARIRQSRRRQQQVRAAAGGTALAAVIAVGAFVITRDEQPALVIQPDATVPATSLPDTVPLTTVPSVPPTLPNVTTPVTPPPTAVPAQPGLSAEAQAWVDARAAEGFDLVDLVPGDGTSARLLHAQRPTDVAAVSALLLDDGRVVATSPELSIAPGVLYGVDGAPAVVDYGADGRGDEVSVWRYDPTADAWATTGDVGIGPLGEAFFGGFGVTVVDDVLVVTNNALVNLDEFTFAPDPERSAGVVVRGDLSVTEMAAAPDRVAMFFNTASGGKAIQMYGMAVEGGSGVDVSYEPWQYDPATNEWTRIPIPDWSDCTGGSECPWAITPDIGAANLVVPTSHGLVTHVPDGTIGLYDAGAGAWTRLDDPPFAVAMPTTAVAGDQMVMAPWRNGGSDFGTIAVLDLATGTWTTEQVSIPADVEARLGTEWIDASWDLRVSGTRVLAAPGPSFQPTPVDAVAVYDTATRTWSEPTPDDVAAWRSLGSRLTG